MMHFKSIFKGFRRNQSHKRDLESFSSVTGWFGTQLLFAWIHTSSDRELIPSWDWIHFAVGWFSSIQSLSRVQFFVTPQSAACQASLCITNSRSWLKLMSIELVMPSNHLIFCHPPLLLPSIFPSIRVFSNESVLLRLTWPKYWSFRFSISPSNEYSGLSSFTIDWFNLLSVQGGWLEGSVSQASWLERPFS